MINQNNNPFMCVYVPLVVKIERVALSTLKPFERYALTFFLCIMQFHQQTRSCMINFLSFCKYLNNEVKFFLYKKLEKIINFMFI